jgi:hypothetical protein
VSAGKGAVLRQHACNTDHLVRFRHENMKGTVLRQHAGNTLSSVSETAAAFMGENLHRGRRDVITKR